MSSSGRVGGKVILSENEFLLFFAIILNVARIFFHWNLCSCFCVHVLHVCLEGTHFQNLPPPGPYQTSIVSHMIQVDLDHLCLFISKYLIIYVHKRNLCRKSSGGYKVYNPRELDKESRTQNVTISNEMLCTVQSGGNVP